MEAAPPTPSMYRTEAGECSDHPATEDADDAYGSRKRPASADDRKTALAVAKRRKRARRGPKEKRPWMEVNRIFGSVGAGGGSWQRKYEAFAVVSQEKRVPACTMMEWEDTLDEIARSDLQGKNQAIERVRELSANVIGRKLDFHVIDTRTMGERALESALREAKLPALAVGVTTPAEPLSLVRLFEFMQAEPSDGGPFSGLEVWDAGLTEQDVNPRPTSIE